MGKKIPSPYIQIYITGDSAFNDNTGLRWGNSSFMSIVADSQKVEHYKKYYQIYFI